MEIEVGAVRKQLKKACVLSYKYTIRSYVVLRISMRSKSKSSLKIKYLGLLNFFIPPKWSKMEYRCVDIGREKTCEVICILCNFVSTYYICSSNQYFWEPLFLALD